MIITLQNGQVIDPSQYSLIMLEYIIPSIGVEHSIESGIITETYFAQREITVNFGYKAKDYDDYKLFIADINALFTREDYFYVTFKREPGKRWKVRRSGSFTPAKLLRKMGTVEVKFICENIYAESVGTSLDLQNKKEWDADLWGWGMGLDWDKEYRYEFNTNVFTVENIGNVVIDPRQHELEIIVKGPFPNGVTITNTTTGDVYKYNGPLTTNDTLKLTGIRSLKNGLSVFGNTNRKLLTLVPGNNKFTVTGGTPTSIAFNFRYLYK